MKVVSVLTYMNTFPTESSGCEGIVNFMVSTAFEGSFFHFKPLLEKRISELILPQQPGAVKVKTPVNQHPQIFKDDNFVIWQRMFDVFNITKSSRTDIDFMFEIMKYNSLIHDNIGFTDIQKWINEVYEIPFDKIKHTPPKQQSNKNRMAAYNLIIQNKGIKHT